MENRLKVVFLHTPLYPINHEFFLELGKRVDLSVIVFGNTPRLHTQWKTQQFYNTTYKIIEVNDYFTGSFFSKTDPRWIKHLKTIKPDIVISLAFWLPSLYACLFKKALGYKFGIFTDAVSNSEKISKKKENYRKMLLKCADFLISASSHTTQYLKTLTQKEIFFSPYALDVKKLKRELLNLPSKEELKKELGIDTDKKILLGVGNLIKKKNWEYVLKNMKNIDNTQFVLVGDGDGRKELENFVKKHDLQRRVKFAGKKNKSELLKYYKISDALILPSLADQFGFVVLEALGSGVPVVCSVYAGASSIVKENINGFTFDPLNENEINDKIQKAFFLKDFDVNENMLEEKARNFVNFLKEVNEIS